MLKTMLSRKRKWCDAKFKNIIPKMGIILSIMCAGENTNFSIVLSEEKEKEKEGNGIQLGYIDFNCICNILLFFKIYFY